ncbi:LuxR C-terminal-related transcriptional regulator [Marinobacter halotolerans]|uniref:LuxR C-terminal-related transcriptional regulator n=1 Tax=Marinobacter halotolerans TaxID=1569211 RepID=UPI00178444E4|nr:LuxR C-terminal-related transcriptional regulator [Marinobacter halotolerans]
MSKETLQKLDTLSDLRMSSAAGVVDALDLVENSIPHILGSMLIWASASGEVAGGFSRLLGIEEGLAAYARGFANSASEETIAGETFRSNMRNQVRSRRLKDIVQMSLADFYETDMFREMLLPWKIRDMARCAVTFENIPLGGLVIFRGDGAPDFSDPELAIMDQCADWIGRLLQCSPTAEVPMVDEYEPGVAELDSEGKLHSATRTFRLHLAMQNQAEPGQGPADFNFSVPPEVVRAASGLENEPQTLKTECAWGNFHMTLERLIGTDRIALTSRRSIPAGLMMFRRTLDQPLSRRQRQVACALAEGDSFHDMAERWDICRSSIITHGHFLYDKLGVAGKSELMNRFVWGRD